MQLRRRAVLQGSLGAGVAFAASGVSQKAQAIDPSLRIAIIGSGYGGAVAARTLTQAGYRVTLIEMGDDWRQMPVDSRTGTVFNKMSDPDGRSTWLSTTTDAPFATFLGLPVVNKTISRYTGVLDTAKFGGIKVYRGVGLGGGSLVNGAMAVVPNRAFFEQVLPQVDSAEMYAKYFPMVTSLLRGSTMPASVMSSKWYQFSRVGAQQAQRAGYQVVDVPTAYDKNYLTQEIAGTVQRSALNQEVIFGNNAGKFDLTKTLLADAFATGLVSLRKLTEVVSMTRTTAGAFDLNLKTINTSGKVVAQATERFDRVILAAGSVGTSKLMVQAKATGSVGSLPDATGKLWGPNGNIMVSRWHGIAVGGYSGTIPAQGIYAWDNTVKSVFAELAPLPIGVDSFSSLYLNITNNPNYGSFGWNGSKVTLDWNSTKAAPSVAAAKAVMDNIKNVNGGLYRTDLFEGGKTFVDYFTYHPLGGMVLGEATDLNGEVKGVPGLFVVDGSLVPAKIGVNPFVTITALAQRNMDRLLAAGRF